MRHRTRVALVVATAAATIIGGMSVGASSASANVVISPTVGSAPAGGRPFNVGSGLYEIGTLNDSPELYELQDGAFASIASLPSQANSFFSFAGSVYFIADIPGSDDTSSDRVTDLYELVGATANVVTNAPTSPVSPAVYAGTLYLTSTVSDESTGLWESTDGSAFTAVANAPIRPGALVAYNGDLYLSGLIGTQGQQGWYLFDGTTFTQVVGAPSYLYDGVVYDGKLYFREAGDGDPWDVFSYDGSRFVNLTGSSALEIDTTYFVYENKLYFGGDTGSDNWGLYSYDGSSFAAVPIKGLDPQAFATVGGQLYYTARDASDVWSTYTYSPFVPILSTTTPIVSGTVAVGRTLTVSSDEYGPGVTVSYAWQTGPSFTVSSDTSSTYVIQPGDVGYEIFVSPVGSEYGYTNSEATPAVTVDVVAGTFSSSPAPIITGTAKVGHSLTAHHGTWTPGTPTFSFQWYRNGTAIATATASTYKLKTKDAHQKISVDVTATESGYTTVTSSSKHKYIAR